MEPKTRRHVHEESFSATPERLFEILVTPTAICGWWGASRAIVIPETGGIWSASWGDDYDAPDYVSSFVIRTFEPPQRIFFDDAKYYARAGKPPFDARMTTEFVIEPTGDGAILRVIQDGFPCDPIADDFYAACDRGWRDTFAGIRRFLAQ